MEYANSTDLDVREMDAKIQRSISKKKKKCFGYLLLNYWLS